MVIQNTVDQISTHQLSWIEIRPSVWNIEYVFLGGTAAFAHNIENNFVQICQGSEN